MKIAVTGGAGFIGSHVVDSYIAAGHDVLVIDNLSSGIKKNIHPKADFEKADITDLRVKKIIKDYHPDVINHQAAQINIRASIDNPIFDAQSNIIGSLQLFEAAKATGVKKIIFASSGGAVYGDTNQLPTDESHPTFPISPYGISKLSVEHYLNYYFTVDNISSVILRYANVYGPRQNPHGEAGVVAIFYQKILSGQDFTINGDGNQTRDFVFVKDVVEANLKALKPKIHGKFNISTSQETSVNDLVEKMKHSINHQSKITHGPAKHGEQQRSCLSFSNANKTLDWEPKYVLKKGLEETARFFQGQ